MFERFVGHDRAEVGSADAYVDDAPNSFAGVALPGAAPDPLGEVRHPLEHGMDVGHRIPAIHDNDCIPGRAEGNVENCAVFGDVDFVASEHGFDPVAQTGFFGQTDEEFERIVGDAVLRVIEEQAFCFYGHPLAALRVIGEEFSQMQLAGYFMVFGEGFPCATLGQWFQG